MLDNGLQESCQVSSDINKCQHVCHDSLFKSSSPQTQPSVETKNKAKLKCKTRMRIYMYKILYMCVTFGEGTRLENLKICHHYITGDSF